MPRTVGVYPHNRPARLRACPSTGVLRGGYDGRYSFAVLYRDRNSPELIFWMHPYHTFDEAYREARRYASYTCYVVKLGYGYTAEMDASLYDHQGMIAELKAVRMRYRR